MRHIMCGALSLLLAATPAFAAPGDTAFAWQLRIGIATPVGLSRFALNDFGTHVVLGQDPTTGLYGMDFDPTGSTLHAVRDTGAGTLELGRLDTVTGAFMPGNAVTLGGSPVAITLSDLAIDPLTGEAWLADVQSLYRVDLDTGAATLIGSFGLSPTQTMIDLAIDCTGAMYGHETATDALYSIDPATAVATLVGPHGYAANFAQGMDFDNTDGRLYAPIYTGQSTFTYGYFNLATGALVPLSADTPPGEWEIAIPTRCNSAGDEVEPNDGKNQANLLQLPPASTLAVAAGQSTGSAGAQLDYFRVRSAAQPTPGIYRHRLTLVSRTPGHVGTLRGLDQSAGVVGGNDTVLQTSSTDTVPQRYVQWYTHEAPADIYYRVEGNVGTTDEYVVNYDVDPVTPIAGPTLGLAPVVIGTVGQTAADTELWVYSAAGDAIDGAGNDDAPAPSTQSQSQLTRTFAEGGYVVAVGEYNLANHRAAAVDDRYRNGNVTDFPGVLLSGEASVGANLGTAIGGRVLPSIKTEPFQVQFIAFAISDPVFGDGFE